MKFIIHGSGANTQVKSSSADVFVNGAILRCTSEYVENVIITSGLLQSDEQLRNLTPMYGQNKKKSYELRQSKFLALLDKNIGNLTIIKSSSSICQSKLERITASRIKFVSQPQLYRIILCNFWRQLIVRHEIILLVVYFLGAVGLRAPKSHMRPSTGVSAGILCYQKTKMAPEFTGISSSTEAFYGSLQVSVEFNMKHSKIDNLFVEIFDELK